MTTERDVGSKGESSRWKDRLSGTALLSADLGKTSRVCEENKPRERPNAQKGCQKSAKDQVIGKGRVEGRAKSA